MTVDNVPIFLSSAGLLMIQHVVYGIVWNFPKQVQKFCNICFGGECPSEVTQKFFYIFKFFQAFVFTRWIIEFGGGKVEWPPAAPALHQLLAVAFIIGGQTLNFAVFQKLGNRGVFYGTKYGHKIPWVTGFPFDVIAHPQYIGTVLSVWGLFILMRFPHEDWYIIPGLETLYYTISSYVEAL